MARLFIVGAGASAAAPAQLPVFNVLRDYLLERLSLPTDGSAHALDLAPERFMQAVSDGGLPLSDWLTNTLSQGEPNAVHRVLRDALDSDDVVWTLNVDELIERARPTPMVVASFDDPAPSPRARLLKPHGTVSRRRYIFRTDQVVRPLPDPWARRLISDGAGTEVVVLGYAGADLDMLAVLDATFAGASRVTWFALERDRAQLLARFPSLVRSSVRFLGGSTIDSLTPAFLSWADGEGLTSGLSASMRELAESGGPLRPPAPLRGDTRLAAALLLERAGDRLGAHRAYARLLWPSKPSRTLAAAQRLLSIDLYEQAPWTRPAVALAAGPAAPLLPRFMRKRLDRAHITILSSHLGDHLAVERRSQRVVNPKDPGIVVALAKAARYRGDYEQGVMLSRQAQCEARGASTVDILAHAVFEEGFLLTWAGRLAEAQGVAERLHGAVGALAGIRWVAWGAWQLACLSLYTEDPGRASYYLSRAESLFEADRTPSGLTSAHLVRLTAARRLADVDSFNATLGRLRPAVNGPGWTSYTTCALEIEQAEFARVHLRDLPQARHRYNHVFRLSRDEPIHRGQALLGLAEVARQAGEDPSPFLAELTATTDAHPIGYLQAHLSITQFLIGELSASAALARIEEVAPQLTSRAATQAASPLDFCLGGRPEDHETFLP